MEQYEPVFSLLKTSLWGQERYPFDPAPGTDWAAAYQELKAHAVAGLAVDTLPLIPELDPALRQEWILSSTRGMMFWHQLMAQQQAVCDLLGAAGIPFAVLKGAAVDLYYPQPEYRAMGDIDLIVRPEDHGRAAEALQSAGFAVVGENGRHTEMKKDGVMLELHRYFAGRAAYEFERILDEKIYSALDTAEAASIGQYHFAMLPRLENGMVLLVHIVHHLRSGIGLRQIIDWMLFVDRELDDDWWRAEFGSLVAAVGLDKLAVTVTRMCQLYLGLREDRITWCAGADEALCTELLEITMARGNFGRKLGTSVTTINVLNRLSDWTGIPKMLQTRGKSNWKALKKYPFLEPLAWLYQIFWYAKRILLRKNPFRQLRADARRRSSENALWDRLEVRRRTEHASVRLPEETEKE